MEFNWLAGLVVAGLGTWAMVSGWAVAKGAWENSRPYLVFGVASCAGVIFVAVGLAVPS